MFGAAVLMIVVVVVIIPVPAMGSGGLHHHPNVPIKPVVPKLPPKPKQSSANIDYDVETLLRKDDKIRLVQYQEKYGTIASPLQSATVSGGHGIGHKISASAPVSHPGPAHWQHSNRQQRRLASNMSAFMMGVLLLSMFSAFILCAIYFNVSDLKLRDPTLGAPTAVTPWQPNNAKITTNAGQQPHQQPQQQQQQQQHNFRSNDERRTQQNNHQKSQS